MARVHWKHPDTRLKYPVDYLILQTMKYSVKCCKSCNGSLFNLQTIVAMSMSVYRVEGSCIIKKSSFLSSIICLASDMALFEFCRIICPSRSMSVFERSCVLISFLLIITDLFLSSLRFIRILGAFARRYIVFDICLLCSLHTCNPNLF